MKIVISLAAQEASQSKAFLEGVSYLKKLGHNVFEAYDTGKKATNGESSKAFDKIDKAIRDTDILIAEITNSDAKVGYEIARALDEKKVVITLEQENKKNSPIVPIHGNKSRTLVKKTYTEDNVIDVINKTLKEAASKLDSKFILIISPEIDRYLEWSSQTKRMHKAQIVRNAVEQMMKKDREYKTYLQG